MAGVLQHLRSSTLNKRPNPASMVDGQVAINYASGSPGMFFKDSNGSLVKVGPVHVGSGAPNVSPASGGTAGNSLGEQWLDTSGGTYVFKIWDGSAWRSEAGEFVNTTGDTMTGALGIIAGSASTPGLFFSGDANSGIYSPGADQVAISTNGTQRLTTDTAAVTSTLPVVHPLGAAATPSLTFTGDLNTGIYSPGADQVAVATNSVQRVSFGTSGVVFNDGGEDYDFRIEGDTKTNLLFVDASTGRVGIGTSPLSMLDVQGTEATGERLIIGTRNNDASTDVALDFYTATSSANRARIEVTRNGAFATGDMRFYTQITNTLSEKMRIDYSGRVGIGTSSPATTLDVNGDVTIADKIIHGGDTNTAIRFPAADTVSVETNGSERARIDSSGRLLVGTSSARTNFNNATQSGADVVKQIIEGADGGFSASLGLVSNRAGTGNSASLIFAKSNATALGSNTLVSADTSLGTVSFQGSDGTEFVIGAQIQALVDGTPGADDMPGRLVFSTTADGASSPTERMRITNDGVMCYDQAAPVSYAAAATLVVGDLKNGLVQYTGAAATLTLPTGTLTEGGFSSVYTNMTFEWSVINTGSGTCTVGNGTGHTVTGSATVAAGASGRFASRRTAANTFVSYRLS